MSAMNLLQSIFGANMGNMQAQQMYGQRGGMPQVFRRKYHAYSPGYWQSDNRDKLESGDKIVLPASALEELSRMQVTFPIMFEIAHDSDILPKKSHCSVMEFTAPEGSCYLPLWMIDNLGLDPQGDSVVELTTITLCKGNFVQFQAHETAFAMLQNPRVVLEKNLRGYSCLTVGDTIQVEFADHIYKLDVTEVRPSIQKGDAPPAISIIETDIKVDFREPRDYKEWEKKNQGKLGKLKTASQSGVVGSPDSKKTTFARSGSKAESKGDDEEDDFGVIDPIQVAKNTKSSYFESLAKSGSSAQTIKKQKSGGSVGSSSSAGSSAASKFGGTAVLGKSRGAPLGSGGRGKSLGAEKAKFVTGSLVGTAVKSSGKAVKKEEEIVGSMRYIYEVDEAGKRTLVRRLPIRDMSAMSQGTTGYSLK